MGKKFFRGGNSVAKELAGCVLRLVHRRLQMLQLLTGCALPQCAHAQSCTPTHFLPRVIISHLTFSKTSFCGACGGWMDAQCR